MALLKSLLISALGASTLISASVSSPGDEPQKPIDLGEYVCEHPAYKVLMVSKSPLVIYIKDFITAPERAHLLKLTEKTFTRSGVTAGNTKSHHSVRTSQSTTAPRDAVVRCIESRALAFQGYDTPETHLEPLQLVKYGPSERYHYHTDWFTSSSHTQGLGGNRISSFFAYVHVANDTMGGGTNFPRLDAPASDKWCQEGIVDCDEKYDNGVTFRPVEGNAIYWENLLSDGRGDERTLHAGLPVLSGGKVGMNIWTRQEPLPEGIRGADL
ncbi:hypothetical protein QBC40DRAFT_287606 [Triangularia verruculosa]|uniref:Fe2OG dioxygenase domain-containing protein n=1 Tax=Triangularia verruculosa TaxID=2587418 RepID=A0AAN6X997_9PEZI|nr:hypothetical protein QBC40DRAFT_287606 [Triangularia verruculosa]